MADLEAIAKAVQAAADVMGAQMRQARRAGHVDPEVEYVARSMGHLIYDYRNGKISMPQLIDGAVAVMAAGYIKVMRAGASDAALDLGTHPESDFFEEAMLRSEHQRGFVTKLMKDVIESNGNGDFRYRLKLYGQSMVGAYNSAYARTGKAFDPGMEIIWELGEAEHCEKCLPRDGHRYTWETLPGIPGDGGFGGPVCDGGPECKCSLRFVPAIH